MKVNLTDSNNLVKVDQDHGLITFYIDPGSYNLPLKLSWDVKLELHLRNSEVVGIPIINKELRDRLTCTSHSVYKPFRGTHDGIHITIDRLKSNSGQWDVTEKMELFSIKLVSLLYWDLLKSKNIDGILPSPIEIILQ